MNNIFINLSLCVLALSGFYLVFSESWTAAYRVNIITHAVLGFVIGFVVLVHYFLHYRKKTNEDFPLSGGLFASCLLLASGTLLILLFPKVFLPLALIAAALLAVRMTKRVLAAVTQRNIRVSAWAGQAVLFLWFACFLSGMALIHTRGRVLPEGYFLFHRYVSYAAVGALLVHIILPLAVRRIYGLPYATRAYLRRLSEALVIFGVCTTAFAIFLGVDSKIPFIRYHLELSTIIEERRENKLPPPLPPDEAELLNLEDSCGKTPGCHATLLADHKIANHSRSIATPYFQKNLREMAREVGERNVLICAGCHYPTLIFRGDTNIEKYANETSFSCVYCHVFEKVAFHPTDRRISYIDIRAPRPHLEMMRDERGDGRIRPLDAYLIKLNPLGHGRALNPPVIKTNDGCQVCHALQIRPPESIGLPRPSCAECHMQERYYLNRKGAEKNHVFPGTNTGLPAALGDFKTVRMVQDWLRGDLTLGVPDITFWSLKSPKRKQADAKAFWLFLNIEPHSPLVAGEDFEFSVLTTNTGIDHSFPSGPLDLLEVWLEVVIEDSRGDTIFHSGYLDEANRIEPAAHTLGGYMLDEQHNILVENRVWAIERKIVDRLIQPGETAADRFTARLPADVGDAIRITARWNYRDLSQEFWEWGMDCADCTYPYSEVGSIEAELRVEPPR